MLLRDIFYSFKPRTRLLVRRLLFLPYDILRKRNKLVPPKGLIFTGAGDFEQIGQKFARKLIEECSLPTNGHVLDIGCGIGRIARPLTEYLDHSGRYMGFDIVPEGIEWCQRHYQPYKNFSFKFVPLRNDLYNLDASHTAASFVLPYADKSFDAVCAISVFTHMQLQDVEHYLTEISRVLKPGSSCLCTFFLIGTERLRQHSLNINRFFRYNNGDYYLHDNNVKDANIAFTVEALERLARTAGLDIMKIEEGWWADKNQRHKFDFQDVIVLRKTA